MRPWHLARMRGSSDGELAAATRGNRYFIGPSITPGILRRNGNFDQWLVELTRLGFFSGMPLTAP